MMDLKPAVEKLAALEIRPMGPEHIREVVSIYLASFDGTFLARLGGPFLQVMFRAFIEGGPRECSLVCLDGQQVVGFVCGSMNRAGYIKTFVRKHLAEALPAVAAAVSSDRQVGLDLLRRIWMLGRVILGIAEPNARELPVASLMTIAVGSNYRNRGAGTSLVKAFTAWMAERGVKAVRLGVSEQNLTARRLYERLGWRPTTVIGRSRSSVCLYVHSLSVADSEGCSKNGDHTPGSSEPAQSS